MDGKLTFANRPSFGLGNLEVGKIGSFTPLPPPPNKRSTAAHLQAVLGPFATLRPKFASDQSESGGSGVHLVVLEAQAGVMKGREFFNGPELPDPKFDQQNLRSRHPPLPTPQKNIRTPKGPFEWDF